MGITEALQARPLELGYPFERILVPLDGSATAERVLFTLRALCGHRASSLTLVRIVEPLAPGTSGPSEQDSMRIAELYLRQAFAPVRNSEIQAKPVVRIGPAAESLLALAEKERASLIAMSTHGRMTAESEPFGKVAEQLFRSASVPILAVPTHAPLRPARPFRTLLVPTREAQPASTIIPSAVDFALAFGADLAVLLQVVPHAITGRGEAEKLVRAEENLRRMARPFASKQIPTLHVVQDGDPATLILRVAQERNVDLIAMNSGTTDGLDATVREVLRASTIPVLLRRSGIAPRKGSVP